MKKKKMKMKVNGQKEEEEQRRWMKNNKGWKNLRYSDLKKNKLKRMNSKNN